MSDKNQIDISELDSGYYVTHHGKEGTKKLAFSGLGEVMRFVGSVLGKETDIERAEAQMLRRKLMIEASGGE